jgi:hypothetical protein
VALLLVMLAGCGRVAFDPLETPLDAASPDTSIGTVHTGRPNIMVLGVQGAFPATMFDAWITSRAQNRASITGNTIVDDAALANTDVIILLSPQKSSYTMAESTAIAAVVARGGALLALTGYQNGLDLTGFNSALVAIGVQGLAMPTFSGDVTDLPPHPITAGVDQLPYTGGYEIAAPATPIGRVNGLVIGTAFDHQAGRVVVWGDEYVTFDTDWDAMVATFWDNALAWAWPTQ